VFTFFVFSTGWDIAKAKILQGADFGCPLVECLPRDGAHWHQKDAKVSERGKGVVLHGRASERRSRSGEQEQQGHEFHILFYTANLPLRARNHTIDFPVLWAVSDKARLLRNMSYPKLALRIQYPLLSIALTIAKYVRFPIRFATLLTTTSIAPHCLSTFPYSHMVHHLSLPQDDQLRAHIVLSRVLLSLKISSHS
jgi:hypothetical protein